MPARRCTTEQPSCPFCESTHLRRSRRRNLWERVVLRLISARPYRCLECDRRFYDRAHPHVTEEAELSPKASAQWGGLAVIVFLAVPLAVGSHLLRDAVQPSSAGRNAVAPAASPTRWFVAANDPAFEPALRLAFAETRETTSVGSSRLQGATQRSVVGSLQVTGQVMISGTPITADTTVFIGDVIRTGSDGAARVTVAGNGTLILAAQTELALSGAPRYLATLRGGVLGIQSLEGARNFQVRVGNFLVVPAPDAPATAEVRLAPDGSAQITCQSGSVGVIALEGEEVLFLRAGQTARITSTGALVPPEPPAPTRLPPAPQAKGGKGKGVIIAVVVGGGAAGAALALAGKKKEPAPVSPSVP